ncbi:MAG TPA: hypothetical protein VGO79_12025 [Thermoanaerobaculia bacterium]
MTGLHFAPLAFFASLAAVALLLMVACGGGLKTITKDGYRAILSFSETERFPIAVRGEWQRVEASVGGVRGGPQLVKIMRPDLKKIWQFLPATKRLFESPWQPTDEIVPGYPLGPRFDPQAYADRFGGQIRKIADAAHGLHPCDRWEMRLPSGDAVTIWVARDLEGLAVRIEHMKKDRNDEYQPFQSTELLDVRTGADEKLFQKPTGYQEVKSYEGLLQ